MSQQSQQPLPPLGATVGASGGTGAPGYGPPAAVPPGGGGGTAPLPAQGRQNFSFALMFDVGRGKRGWFPRWWILSTLFCLIVVSLAALIEPVICTTPSHSALLCQVATWTDWRQVIITTTIWLLFILGWLIAYLFGAVYIEQRSADTRGPVATFFYKLSEFETTYHLWYIYASCACLIIVVIWYFRVFQVEAFGICTLVIFTGAACFLHRLPSLRERRPLLLGVALLALFSMVVMFWIGPFQLSILIAEIMVVAIGVGSVFLRTPPVTGVSPTQTAALARAQQNTPFYALLTLLWSLGIGRPRHTNPPPSQQGQGNIP